MIFVCAPVALAACATTPTKAAQSVSQQVATGLGATPKWPRDEASRTRVHELLKAPLTQSGAVEIAILHHPRVVAAFEGLGVARADFLDAVLPAPPTLKALRLEDADAGVLAARHYGVALEIARLLTLPASVRAANAGETPARARAAADILSVAGQARAALIDFAAARQDADLMAQAAQSAEAAAFAAEKLYEAGNIAKVDRDREALFAAEIVIANTHAQAMLVPARERLIAALGLTSADAAMLESTQRLPAPPETAPETGDLETRVISANTDLAMAMAAVEASKARRSVSWLDSIIPGLGVEWEREREEDERIEGFGLDWRAPLFDLGGAERLRRAAAARRAEALAQAIDLEARAEARALLAETEAARKAALSRREVVLPLSAEVFDGAQLDFHAMEIGVLQLLEAKRMRLDAGRASIAATRDYWRAQARLDLLIAGAGSSAPSSPGTDRPDMPNAAAKPDH